MISSKQRDIFSRKELALRGPWGKVLSEVYPRLKPGERPDMTERSHTAIEPPCGVPDCASSAMSGLPVSTQGGSLLRRCPACGKSIPAAAFSKGAWRCKPCQNAYNRKWYLANKPRAAECSKRWVSANRERVKANAARWKKENRKHLADYFKAKHAAADKAELREKARQYRERNREKYAFRMRAWYANNTEVAKANARKWREANRDKRRASNLKRRACKRGAVGYGYTTAALISLRWEMWGNKCWVCGKPATATDHVIPLQPNYRDATGAHLPANLRPVCGRCNSSRQNNRPPALTWIA